MHPYEFLQRYGPTALVMEVTAEPGEAFASELAKGGFDLLLPCAHPDKLQPLEARLEDHEGVNVELFETDIDGRHCAETLYANTEDMDIGLFVCGVAAGHPKHAGSLISSLTRVFMPRLRARKHSGIIMLDLTGTTRRFGETLAHELKPQNIDVLTVCAEDGPEAVSGDFTPRELAKLALEKTDQGPTLSFDPQGWG